MDYVDVVRSQLSSQPLNVRDHFLFGYRPFNSMPSSRDRLPLQLSRQRYDTSIPSRQLVIFQMLGISGALCLAGRNSAGKVFATVKTDPVDYNFQFRGKARYLPLILFPGVRFVVWLSFCRRRADLWFVFYFNLGGTSNGLNLDVEWPRQVPPPLQFPCVSFPCPLRLR